MSKDVKTIYGTKALRPEMHARIQAGKPSVWGVLCAVGDAVVEALLFAVAFTCMMWAAGLLGR